MVSWLLRLATRLGVSLDGLASESFGIHDPLGHSQWWRRPHRSLLEHISARTDVSAARLWRMTFGGWHPAYQDDEAHARFSSGYHDRSASKGPEYRIAVCTECLKGDKTPHLRTAWLIGWMAACAVHGTSLVDRCPRCRAGLRVLPCSTQPSRSVTDCALCGRSVLLARRAPAHASVLRLQAVLLKGKREGITELAGLGRFTWTQTVALADVLVGTASAELTAAERQRLWARHCFELRDKPCRGTHVYDGRRASLRFLAWLTEGWPHSEGAVFGRALLERLRSGLSDVSYPIESGTKRRIWKLLDSAAATV